jgi:hypothetical protein
MGGRHESETGGWPVPGVLGRKLGRRGERPGRRRPAVWLAWGAFALTVAFTTAGVVLLGFLSDPEAGTGGAEELQGWLLVTLAVPFSFVGALIIARRPGNRIGQLLLCGAMSFAAFLAVGGYVSQGGERGRDLPGLTWAAWVSNWVWMPALVALLLLLLVYPNGRLVSRRWRPVAVAMLAWSALVTLALVLYPDAVGGGGPRPAIALQGAAGDLLRRFLSSPHTPIPPIAFLAAGVVALGVRARRSRGDERQQVKWLAYAATLVALTFVLSALPVTAWLGDVIATVLWLAVWGIPVTIGGRHPQVPAVRHRPDHQPHAGVRGAHRGTRRCLCDGSVCPRPAARPRRWAVRAGRGGHHAGRSGAVPAGQAMGAGRRGPAVQPRPVRRGQNPCGVQYSPARPDRSRHDLG